MKYKPVPSPQFLSTWARANQQGMVANINSSVAANDGGCKCFRRDSTMAQRRRVWCFVIGGVLCLSIFAVVVGVGIAIYASMNRQQAGGGSASALIAPKPNQDQLASMISSDSLSPSSLDQNTCKNAVCLDYGKIDVLHIAPI